MITFAKGIKTTKDGNKYLVIKTAVPYQERGDSSKGLPGSVEIYDPFRNTYINVDLDLPNYSKDVTEVIPEFSPAIQGQNIPDKNLVKNLNIYRKKYNIEDKILELSKVGFSVGSVATQNSKYKNIPYVKLKTKNAIIFVPALSDEKGVQKFKLAEGDSFFTFAINLSTEDLGANRKENTYIILPRTNDQEPKDGFRMKIYHKDKEGPYYTKRYFTMLVMRKDANMEPYILAPSVIVDDDNSVLRRDGMVDNTKKRLVTRSDCSTYWKYEI